MHANVEGKGMAVVRLVSFCISLHSELKAQEVPQTTYGNPSGELGSISEGNLESSYFEKHSQI